MEDATICEIYAADAHFFNANQHRRIFVRAATVEEAAEMRASGIEEEPGYIHATLVIRTIDNTVLTLCMRCQPSMVPDRGERDAADMLGYYFSLLDHEAAAHLHFLIFGKTVGGVQ